MNKLYSIVLTDGFKIFHITQFATSIFKAIGWIEMHNRTILSIKEIDI